MSLETEDIVFEGARMVRVQAVPPNRIFLWLRGADGSKVRREIVGLNPHFWVPGDGSDRSLFGDQLREVVVPNFKLVPEERARYPRHWEADVPFSRRFLIDSGIKSGVLLPDKDVVNISEVIPAETSVAPRQCYLDIEVCGEGSLDVFNTPAPVVAFSAWDSYEREYVTFVVGKSCATELANVHLFKDERALLGGIAEYLERTDPDVVVAWNARYDTEYLRNRSRKLGIYIPLPVEVFDLERADKRLHKRLSYELKEVALEEGLTQGEPVDALEALERYERGDVGFLARYNRDDVRYMVGLDGKYGITEFFEGLKDFSGVAHYGDTLKFSVMDDTMLLRLAHELEVVLPSAPDKGLVKEAETYKGALVDFFTPDGSARKGMFENVAVYDFSRYYPSIIRELNISPEVSSSTDNPGIIPQLVVRLFAERDKLEVQLARFTPGTSEHEALKRKRDVVKFLVNSLYGVLGFPLFRLYNRELAAKVTEAGREGLKHMAAFARDLGYEPVYGDTDSLMLQVPFDKTSEIEQSLNKEIANYFAEKYDVQRCDVKMDLNYFAKRVLFTGVKKRYAAHVVYEHKPCDYLRIAGYETIRTDQSKFTKDIQRKLFDLVLREKRENVIAYVRKTLEDFRHQPPERIAFRKGIEKSLGQYGKLDGGKRIGVPAHVRGAIYSNRHFGTHFGAGSRPLFLYVKRVHGKPQTDIVAFERKAPEGCDVDWRRMEQLTLRGKVEGILEAAKISWDEIEGKKQFSLADFI